MLLRKKYEFHRFSIILMLLINLSWLPHGSAREFEELSKADYLDRCEAIWTAQIIGVFMGWQFEHKPAAVEWIADFPDYIYEQIQKNDQAAMVDDDWYYEMANLRAFEKYGVDLTVQELGRQWAENNVGVGGSSGQARKNILKGIQAPWSGHPRYNRLWFTMGAQNRCDLYGMLAPGMPNLAGRLARNLQHINSYAEGTDGGVLVATMISMAFFEKDPRKLLRQAVKVLDPRTPHRQCLELVVALAKAGKTATECANAVMDRWQIEYPATNNSVANFGLVAVALWFGDGDFLKSLNVGFAAADYSDADCNAATAAVIVAAMHGMKAIPTHLVKPLNNHMKATQIGPVELIPPVDEKISDLAARTVALGQQMIQFWGGRSRKDKIFIPVETDIITQAPELFHPNEFIKWWNPDWTLERAGYGAPGGGHRGIRGGTFIDEGVLATYPRDEVRGVLIKRTVKLDQDPVLKLTVGADPGRSWRLEIRVQHTRVLNQLIEGGPPLEWKTETGEPEWFIPLWFPPPQDDYQRCKVVRKYQQFEVDLNAWAAQIVTIRIYQSPLVLNKYSGNAYWKELRIE